MGNVRYTFHQSPITGLADRLQSDDYYPYGLRKSGSPQSLTNKYLYNGKEIQDELGTYDYGVRFYDPVTGRFNMIDPLAEKSRRYSPYVYGNNNPIRFIDVDGMYAESPIFDINGDFLGTDDQGISGSDIVMKRENFKQGMSHNEAVKKDLGVQSLNYEATKNWYSFSKTIESRPDYDGFVSIKEGVDWAKSNPGALQNPTPRNTLYIDASKLDFGNITTSDLKNGVGESSPVNLNTPGNFFASSSNATLASTVYALGRVDLTLLNSDGSVKVVNNSATDYDWNKGGGPVRSTLIDFERWRAELNDTNGFKTFYYGTGQLNK